VQERGELIYLPTAESMLAEVKIPESSLKKVKVGMPCRVTVDAVPNRLFAGRVAKIGVLPSATEWWGNPDLKVYTTEIHLDDGADLRAGMSCRAEIVVETYPQALFVPIQCVVREGRQTVVYRSTGKGSVAVPVEVGLDNNSMVRILSGVKKGEDVLLNPPLSGEPAAEEGGAGGPKAAPASKPAAAPAKEEAAPGSPGEARPGAKEGAPSDAKDWRSMTPEERKKALEALTPEQRQALEERMKRRRGGDGSR
jgi:HlyD family secretion protein